VIYSLTETEIETEKEILSLTETKRETEMFCKTETKDKRKSERTKLNSNHGDHLSGKPGNVREFETCQGCC